jgi:hypothetical protein
MSRHARCRQPRLSSLERVQSFYNIHFFAHIRQPVERTA